MMISAWTTEQLDRIDTADELRIAVRREDGSPRRPLPIWVVRAGGTVYVRTWRRRETGWFGGALRTRRARISVPGVETDVTVEDVGAGPADLRADVDAAYRAKYGRYGRSTLDSMVSDAAAASTLRLVPEPRVQCPGGEPEVVPGSGRTTPGRSGSTARPWAGWRPR
jgi:hypothetical protein